MNGYALTHKISTNPMAESLSNSQPSPPSTTMSPPQPTPSPPLTDLQNISTALSVFQTSFTGLQLHLNTLKTAVDTLIANYPQIPILPSSISNPIQQSRSNFDDTTVVDPPIPETPINNVPQKDSTDEVETISIQELKTLCETMNGKGLKRFLVLNMKDIYTLRIEVPKALNFAPNPAKLVIECCGRFYMQGSRTYSKGSKELIRREASVLILECFVLMERGENEPKIDEVVKQEADQAAASWKTRMVTEGGISQAWRIDVRGLLLLIAGFGVPLSFTNLDLVELFRCCNVREMAGTLRRSSVLMTKVPDIIEGMITNKLEVDAIDFVYTFGFEDRFNVQTILTSILQKVEEPSSNKGKKLSRGAAPAVLNEANRKQLASLKSLVKCLKDHKIDFSGWQVQEKISSLENDISDNNKKIREDNSKRKSQGGRSKFKELKRSRHTGQWQPQEVGHNSPRHYLDTNGYPASHQPTLHAHVARTGYATARAYEEIVVDPSGHVINHGVQPYRYHADPSLTERVVTHSYAPQPSSSSLYMPSSLEGYAMLQSVPHQGTPTDIYRFADSVVDNEYHPSVVPPNHTSYPY